MCTHRDAEMCRVHDESIMSLHRICHYIWCTSQACTINVEHTFLLTSLVPEAVDVDLLAGQSG